MVDEVKQLSKEFWDHARELYGDDFEYRWYACGPLVCRRPPYDWTTEKPVVTLQSIALKAQRNKGVIWMTCDEYDYFRTLICGITFPGMCFGRHIVLVDTFDTMQYIYEHEAG